jgi:hypothetical protein
VWNRAAAVGLQSRYPYTSSPRRQNGLRASSTPALVARDCHSRRPPRILRGVMRRTTMVSSSYTAPAVFENNSFS